MFRLIVIRHAKSAYPSGVRDHDRPLSERGRTDAHRIAERVRGFLPADVRVGAVVSTATRAQQTWRIVNDSLAIPSWSDRSLYLAEPPTILETAAAMDAEIGIVIGHNPGLEELARSTRGAQEIADPLTGRRLVEKFPTSAFAVLDCHDRTWVPANMTCAGFAVCR